MDATLYWHFLPKNRRLRWGDRRVIKAGNTCEIEEQPILCQRGYHASERAIDALEYAPGPIVCRVTIDGEVIHDTDKVVAQSRTVVWMADATRVLHEFACTVAEKALDAANVIDTRCWDVIQVKRKWLAGEVGDEDLETAREAARVAARDAARYAARDAARVAARNAARDAAWGTARDAARDAARVAARYAARDAAWGTAWEAAREEAKTEQNDLLTQMLLKLRPRRVSDDRQTKSN